MKPSFILFDLDGTLLPMDQSAFIDGYFQLLANKLTPRGYDAKALVKAIWAGTAAMVQNDGTKSNESAFWTQFQSIFGEKVAEDKPLFEEFYAVEFQQAAKLCGFNPMAKTTIERLKAHGFQLALATNPLFPAVATESRIRWAGLDPSDFAIYTTYENSRWCKPSLGYYRELLQKLNCAPQDAMMVGNDVDEDMVVQQLGCQVFLLTDCLINKSNAALSQFPHGSFSDLLEALGCRS